MFIQKRKIVLKSECNNWLHVCVIALLALFALTFFIAAASAEGEYTYITKWGSEGTGDGQFDNPRGVAVDSSGDVFVTDEMNYRIQKFDSSGTYITKWGSKGTGDGQFYEPNGIAVDSSGNVFVADSYGNHRIQKFDSSGTYITKWGSWGSGDGQFKSPHGVAVDSSGNVFVADTTNYRIQKFDSSGTYITKWGSKGTGDGQFNGPCGVAVDSSGDVFVADYGNNRIQKFDSSGTYITKWGSWGSGDGQFYGPYGVAVDSSGDVFVADAHNNRIQKFDSSGTYITKWGSEGTGNGQFDGPYGVAVDSSGDVFVADTYNGRIQKFGEGSAPPHVTGINPDYGYRGETLDDVSITGSDFRDVSMTVELQRGAETLGGTDVLDISDTEVTCDFDLTDASVGTWDVYLKHNDDGRSSTLDDAFVVHWPAISVSKTASTNGVCPGTDPLTVQIGDTVTYCFIVSNTGDVTLTGVTVNDDIYGAVTLGTTTLAPGETTEGTKTHTVVESDAPSVTDTATATGTDPLGGSVTDTDPCTINVALAPGIAITKTANVSSATVGTVIGYTINVANTGNVNITNVLVTDSLTGLSETIPTLAPGATQTFNTTYTVTEPDICAPISNTATANGTDPCGNPVGPVSATVIVTQGYTTGLSVVKNANVTSATVGTVIGYTINVANTGDVNLISVLVTDNLTGLYETIPTLAPGATQTFNTTYTVTESDICGLIVNTATANGTDPCGYLTPTAQGVFGVRPMYNADLSIVKTASLTGTCPGSDPLAVSIGDMVTYCFNVTNTGDVTLTSVTVNDDIYGPVTLGTTTLAPGETTGSTVTHVVVESDAPSVTNTATASGTDPCGGTVTDTDPCTINMALAPGIEVNKTAYPTAGPPCTNVTFTINVTNTGDCALNPVTVVDTLPVGMSYVATGTSPAPSSVAGNEITWNNVGPLNPGAFTTITLVAHIDTGAEGTLTDTVTATGKPPAGDNVTDSDTADVTVTGLTCTCGDICVNESGWWRDGDAFNPSDTPIQGAIDNAIAGETICVKDGTYNENVDVNMRLTIKSENGADSTIVQAADPDDHVFEVTADYVNISGFTISGVYSGWKAGIGLYYADYCYISNNNIFKNPGFSNPAYGICLDHSSNNTVSNNDVSESGYHGIYLKSSHYNNILSNIITKNPHKGLWLYYSNNNNINNNTCSNNGGGIELKASVNNNVMENTYLNNGIGGISIWVCSDINYIENNICSSNGYRGIYLDSSHNQRITKNICTNNDKGILLSWGSSKNIITKNTCSNNNYGIWLGSLSASNNVIYLNNLINNNQNVYSTESSTNFWNSLSELTYTYSGSTYTNHLGNYWSDYSGNDTDRDGIGDTPYSIIGSDNDNYPLMELWENYLPFVYDTTPPSSITNLQNTTGTTWINWTWTNPPDADFNYTMIHLDGTWKINTSNEYYNATELNPDTSYEIRTHTVDKVGNVNETWVNQTAKTKTAKVPPNIISFAPPSPVSNNEGESRTFNITVDQIVNVSWQINGSIVQTNECVAEASYTNTSAVVGTWNVSAIASNANGTDSQTWIWNVTEAPQGNDWGIKLDVTSGAGTDVAEFGLNEAATDGFDPEFDVPEPPSPPSPYQQAYFYYPENTLIKKLSTSYIPHHYVDGADAEWNSWPFRLDYSGDASDVTITWDAGDIAAVPENYSLFFVVDGDQVDMRTTPSYTFSATAGTYEFEIIAITAVPYTFVLSTGWNMISFPVEPLDKDADAIFGPEYYYLCTWDPDTGCYVPVDAVETEVGYWLLVLEDRSVTVLGTQLSEYNTDITQGWNMIGSLWTATNVPGGTETVPAEQMYPYIYAWCGDHYALTQDIEPGLGYWALAYVDCGLHVFPAPSAAPLPVQQITWGDNDWHVRLALTSGAGTDVAEFGLHEDATDDFSAKLDVPEPPSPPLSSTSPYQQVYFYDPENPLVKKLSTCYIPHHFDDDDEYNSWLFRLDYSGDTSYVTITWNAKDINAVPAEYSLLFIADGEQIDMRTTQSYTFRAKTTRTYEFEIRAITGGKKPDLVIEEEYENYGGQAGSYTVFFVVKNIGTATAPEGHYATLYVDGVEKDKKLVPTDLEPGETYKGSFKTKVGLTGKVENIKVCADSYNDVDELDEDNNCLKGRWQRVAEKPPMDKPPTDKPPADKPPKEKGAGLGD